MANKDIQFFLDSKGGSLAFLKEEDFADWGEAVRRVNPTNEPSVGTTSDYLVTEEHRKAVLIIYPNDTTKDYSFSIMARFKSTSDADNGDDMDDFYTVDGGSYSGIAGKFATVVNVQTFNGVFCKITNKNTDVTTELAPIPFV